MIFILNYVDFELKFSTNNSYKLEVTKIMESFPICEVFQSYSTKSEHF